jgi:hypothetical protein
MRLLKQISKKMNNYANWRWFIPLLLMLFGVLSIMNRLTSRIKSMHQEIPDMRYWGYNMHSLKEFLDQISAIGREDFVKNLYVDFLFILLFMIFTSLFITYLTRKADIHSSLRYLNLLPILRSLLDVGENIIFLFICTNYPSEFPMLASIGSVVTITKFVVLWSMGIVMIWLFIIIIVRQIQKKRRLHS